MSDMKKKDEKEIIIKRIDQELTTSEENFLGFLELHNLPNNNIFASINQRKVVYGNSENVLSIISDEQRKRSVYISKFFAAVKSGLFDAALNYLWDETILHLRVRVTQYDLSYFFDQAVQDSNKRNKLKDESDLVKLDDFELIEGAKKIELISDLGFKHLDFIRYMRNWASAAHPNQNEITGLQLIAWLETCYKEVISLPISSAAVEIRRLLTNLKVNTITQNDAKEIASFIVNLNKEQISNLTYGLFGIYTRADSSQSTIDNINLLLPFFKSYIDNETKSQLGIRYGKFVANNEEVLKNRAKTFIQTIDASQFIPTELLVNEIDNALNILYQMHNGRDNFYSEPVFAQNLLGLIGDGSKVPKLIQKKYVLSLVYVGLSNGNGVAWNAEPIYFKLISNFNQEQARIVLLAFRNASIKSKLQFKLCQEKYSTMLELIEKKFTDQSTLNLIKKMKNYKSSFDKMDLDSEIKKLIDNMEKLI